MQRTACARAQFNRCSLTTNGHSETGQRPVCYQNLMLGTSIAAARSLCWLARYLKSLISIWTCLVLLLCCRTVPDISFLLDSIFIIINHIFFSSIIYSIALVSFKLWDICFLIIWHFYLIVLMLYKFQFGTGYAVSHLILFLVLFVTFLHWPFLAHALFSLQSFRLGFIPSLQDNDGCWGLLYFTCWRNPVHLVDVHAINHCRISTYISVIFIARFVV
jgi:hypothetical protein